jgi:hypothetical protein
MHGNKIKLLSEEARVVTELSCTQTKLMEQTIEKEKEET